MNNEIWICRHGRTEWNQRRIRQGHMNSPLSAEGVEQANLLAKQLNGIEGVLFSSPLGRALDTAKIVVGANCELSLNIDKRLKEISFGVLDGKSKDSLDPVYSRILQCFKTDPFGYSLPCGESYTDLLSRADSFLRDTFPIGCNIVVIAHEDINRMLLMRLLNISKEDSFRMLQPNNIAYRIRGGKAVAIDLNDSIEHEGILYQDAN